MPCQRAIGFRISTSAIRKASRPIAHRGCRRTGTSARSFWCAAGRREVVGRRDAGAQRAARVQLAMTRRSRSITGRNIQQAHPLREPHSVCDFLIVEGYERPQPQSRHVCAAGRGAASGYWIAHIDVTRSGGLQALSGRRRVRSFSQVRRALPGARRPLRGDGRPRRARSVVVEFPELSTRRIACYRSPDYQAAIDLRRGKAEFDLVIIEGFDGRAVRGARHGQGVLDRARRGEQRKRATSPTRCANSGDLQEVRRASSSCAAASTECPEGRAARATW